MVLQNDVPERDEGQHMSVELVIAMGMYHKMLIQNHLDTIQVFLEPMGLDAAVTEKLNSIVRQCRDGRDHFNLLPLDTLLKNLVMQLKEVSWDEEHLGDLRWFLRNSGHFYLQVENADGVADSVDMGDILMKLESKLAPLTGKGKSYVQYCTGVVFVHLACICKLAVDYDVPTLAQAMCKPIRAEENALNLLYSSVNTQLSEGSRRMTEGMAEMLSTISRTWMQQGDEEGTEALDEDQMKYLAHFLDKIAPHMQGVCSTVHKIIDSTSQEDFSKNIGDTISNLVSKNIGNLMPSDPYMNAPSDKKFRDAEIGTHNLLMLLMNRYFATLQMKFFI